MKGETVSEFQTPIPIFRSFDEKLTKEFYVDFLGFDIIFEHRFEPDTPLYFGVRLGDCILHLSEHFGDATPGSAVRIDMPDVKSYCMKLNEKNYKNARPHVQHQTWGYHEMNISDPSGNRLIFGTPCLDR